MFARRLRRTRAVVLVVVIGAEEFFGVPVGVGSWLAAV